MTDTSSQAMAVSARLGPAPPAAARGRLRRNWPAVLVAIFVIGNLVGILYIWAAGGEDGIGYHWTSFDNVLLSLGRITAFLSGYLALVEVILLARVPFIERAVGFDRLTVWHRWNGHAVIYFALIHVVCTVWGYARIDGQSWFTEYWRWLTLPQSSNVSIKKPVGHLNLSGGLSIGGGGTGGCHSLSCASGAPTTSPYPGIITATIGTAILVLVLVTSLVIVRRKLSYEWWYAVHFTAYAGIALAFLHMVPDGNDVHVDHIAGDYWISLFALALFTVVWFRLLHPVVNVWRFGMRVSEVIEEGPGVISVRVTGKNLDRLHTKAGQFFFWRFFTKGFWYTQHPFSLSEAPRNDSFRITVKNLGDHTAKFGQIPVGTRVFAEGPFGVFTDDSRTRDKSLLIAGGIGITPVRALLEEMDGDVVALYRVVSADDLVFADELDGIAERRGVKVNYVVGDHASAEGRDLLSPRHLKELVPDIAERDVFICGPVGMIDSIVPNLKRANVPRDHLHVERFAL
jgi:predicted ferric reductase